MYIIVRGSDIEIVKILFIFSNALKLKEMEIFCVFSFKML